MTGIVTFMAVLKRNKHRALIGAIIVAALVLGFSAHCKKASVPNTEASVQLKELAEIFESVSADNELLGRIRQSVKGLEYPDEVAEDFTQMAMDWKDELGRPVPIVWKDRLAKGHRDYQQGKISRNRVAKIEERVVQELCERITRQFSPKELAFELSDVIQNRQADCLGFMQLTYIAGNAIGLSVRPMDVLDYFISPEDEGKKGHIACIVDLFDGQLVMADALLLFESPSRAFKLEDQFVKVGNYWELRDKDNPLRIHRRIQLLDRKGLIAAISNSRGYVYKSKGEYERAILEYSKAIEIDPRRAGAYNNRGVTYAHKREFEQAVLDFTRAIEIDPKYATAYTNRGKAFGSKREYDRAIADHTKAIEINPKFADAYINRGNVYADKNESDRAILDYTKAIEIDPKDADAYLNRGVIYADKGEFEQAILDYTKAIEIDPKYAMAYTNRGNAFDAKREHDRAIADHTKAIEINPKFAGAYNNRGNVYAHKNEYDRAILDYTKAIENDPRLAMAYNNRGTVYSAKDEHDRAILDYTKAIEIDPRFVKAYNNRGVAYADKGEYDLATLDYEKAIETNPEYAMAYLNRGEVYAELGKSEEAKKDLLRAIGLDPELKESIKKVSEQYELDLKLD